MDVSPTLIDTDLTVLLRQDIIARLRMASRRLKRQRIRPADIHQARVAVKRARALVALALGEQRGLAKRLSRALGDVNKTLSNQRDSDVIRQTLRAFASKLGVPIRLPRIERDATAAALAAQSAALSLDALAETVQALPMSPLDWPRVMDGLRLTQQKGRRRYRRALKQRNDERFHDCRKDAKTMAYQLEAIALAPGHVGVLSTLASNLGEHRDLGLMRVALQNGLYGLPEEPSQVLELAAAKRQRRLEKRVKRLFSDSFALPSWQLIEGLWRELIYGPPAPPTEPESTN